MRKLHLLVLMPMILLPAQTVMAETIKNAPPALEEKNSMPNATYTSKYLGPQIVVTRDSVKLTQGYDEISKTNTDKSNSPALKKDVGSIKPVGNGK